MAARRGVLVGMVVGGVLAFTLAVGHGARADDGKCKPLSWAPQPLPGCALDAGDGRAWGQVTFSLPDGDKRVELKRLDCHEG